MLQVEIRALCLRRCCAHTSFCRPTISWSFCKVSKSMRHKESRNSIEHPNTPGQVRLSVLRRDGWRCQLCGNMQNLQVHHQVFRSHGGNGSEQNLITLCCNCHSRVHGA